MRFLSLLVILAAGGAAGWVRLSPVDPAIWHVDPLGPVQRNPRASTLLAPGGDGPAAHTRLPPAEAARRIDAIARATPRTRLLAGGGTFVTYVSRSALWGFPDITSIRIVPQGDGADIAIFARSRFGGSDFGVNAARVAGWLTQLPP